MRFDPLFLLIISLATVSSLIDIHPASAQRPRGCYGGHCPVITRNGAIRGGGTLPAEVMQKVNVSLSKQNFTEAESILVQFLAQAERTQNQSGQAAAHQALGDVYTRMSRPDLAYSHLKSAETLYQRLGNSQGLNGVQLQIRQIQPQQR